VLVCWGSVKFLLSVVKLCIGGYDKLLFHERYAGVFPLFATCPYVLSTLEPGYNDIGLHDTSSIASDILW
jgi:hypothetical protein